MSDGFETLVYAEAVAKNGTVLGRTSTGNVALPPEWAIFGDLVELHGMEESPVHKSFGFASWKKELKT